MKIQPPSDVAEVSILAKTCCHLFDCQTIPGLALHGAPFIMLRDTPLAIGNKYGDTFYSGINNLALTQLSIPY